MTTLSDVALQLSEQVLEQPCWAFGDSGARCAVLTQAGVARNVFEKIDDAAQVHKYTGVAPKVALHMLWDKTDSYRALRKHAENRSLCLGTINSNTFQGEDHRLCSVTHSDRKVRQEAIDHHFACIDIMGETGSRDLKVWIADGVGSPGQGDLRSRQQWLAESLHRIYERLGKHQRLVLEYKFFGSAFYHSDVPDWSTAYAQVASLGERAVVCLNTGHYAAGTSIEFIVAQLLRLGKLGSLEFNSRLYTDNALIIGAADPFKLFRILFEIVRTGDYGYGAEVAFALDECRNIRDKVSGQIRSVLHVQEMTARALMVDQQALEMAQSKGDALLANEIFMNAFYTDVRPFLASWRESRGLPADPIGAYARSEYCAGIS